MLFRSGEPPARGVARAFDSNEATLRLAALTVVAPGAVDLTAPTVVLRREPRGWGRRDTVVLVFSAMAGLLVAALILYL